MTNQINKLEALANGIDHAITTLNDGKHLDFFLVVVKDNVDKTTFNTITGIQDFAMIRHIGQHLIEMADAQEPSLDPDNDFDIKGHA